MIALGTRLGPYEIVSQLRAGGRGEVDRAKDTRVNRMLAKEAENNDKFGTTEEKP
jgi:hypothetical protein